MFVLFIAITAFVKPGTAATSLNELKNALPEKTLTLDFVLAVAVAKASSFKAVRAGAYDVPVSHLKANSAFDTQLKVSQSWLHDQSQPANNFSPNDIDGDELAISLSKYFSTGTAIEVSASQGHNKIGFPSGSIVSIPPYYESQTKISLSQNLWADTFGYSSRRQLKAAKLASEAEKYNFMSTIEKWTIEISEAFYRAWFSKNQTLAAQEGLKRQARLLATAKVQL